MSPTISKGVIAYIRASTHEQGDSRLGLEAQLASIEAEVERRGWKLVGVYQDIASGRNMDRPGLKAALAELDAKRADGLIAAKMDRLSRSVKDVAALIEQAKRRWALVMLDLNLDTSTPSGEAMAHMLATFAQLERRLIGERTREAMAALKARNVRLGRPIVLDPKVEARIVNMRREGATYSMIANALNADNTPTAKGARAWTEHAIWRVCKRNDVPKFKRGPRKQQPAA